MREFINRLLGRKGQKQHSERSIAKRAEHEARMAERAKEQKARKEAPTAAPKKKAADFTKPSMKCGLVTNDAYQRGRTRSVYSRRSRSYRGVTLWSGRWLTRFDLRLLQLARKDRRGRVKGGCTKISVKADKAIMTVNLQEMLEALKAA